MQYTIFNNVITLLLGIGILGLNPVCQAAPFYDGPLWDVHSHVDEGTNKTKASVIADSIYAASAGDMIQNGTYTLTVDLPGTRRITLFPKNNLDGYMQDTLAKKLVLQHRLITSIGFQNSASTPGANNGWKDYVPSTPGVYDPVEDAFLNDVETRAASGSYQWLGEMALYGQLGESTEIKADLFDPAIEARILRVLDIAASNGIPLTIHHTVTDTNGNPIGDQTGTWMTTDTAAQRFMDILQTHIDNLGAGEQPAKVVWAHWGGLSTPQAILDMINQFPNLYFDLAWFNKGLTAFQPEGVANPLLKTGCNIINLSLCTFTSGWGPVISSNPDRFLAGMDAGKNSEYKADYQVRELILRTVLGTLNVADAQMIASGNLQHLLGVDSAPADGDITLDGVVNAADILLGQQALQGLVTLPPLPFKHGDVAPLTGGIPDPDDSFTTGDELVIQRKALGDITF
jgi:hypothetical protein